MKIYSRSTVNRDSTVYFRYTKDKTGRVSHDQLYKMVKDFADEIGAPEDHCNDCVRYILALFNADEESHLDVFVSILILVYFPVSLIFISLEKI